MSFLAPWAFGAGVFAALAAVALHLLSTRRPPRAVLPTARFVPESEARAVSRSSRPTDLLLLACRVLAALLIGAAFARPVPDAPGPSVRTVFLVDVSASVADLGAVSRELATRVGEGDAIVHFATTAMALDAAEGGAMASAGPLPRAEHGILSAALVAGVREARKIARGADSVRLVLISPLVEEAFDAATASARAAWPGGITLVRVAGVSDTARGPAPTLDTPLADDPIAPAITRLDAARGVQQVRIVRRAPSAADSAWAREGERAGPRSGDRAAGRVLVHWPVGAQTAARAEGVIAFGLREATLVAPLARLEGVLDTTASPRVIARWRDGVVAATERRVGAGCVRDVAVGIPLAGDITLRPPFTAFLQAMVEPCGGARGLAVSDSVATAFADGDAAVPATRLTAASAADSTLAAWLLGAALLALAAEWFVRRRRTS